MPAHKGNNYAAKNKGLDSRLNVGCKETDKEAWRQVAKATGNNLTDWSNQTLNAAVIEYCKAARDEYFNIKEQANEK